MSHGPVTARMRKRPRKKSFAPVNFARRILGLDGNPPVSGPLQARRAVGARQINFT